MMNACLLVCDEKTTALILIKIYINEAKSYILLLKSRDTVCKYISIFICKYIYIYIYLISKFTRTKSGAK